MESDSRQVAKFKQEVRSILEASSQYEFDATLEGVSRRNKYRIRNEEDILSYLDRHPLGIFIDEEFTDYTFPEVRAVVERLIEEKKIKRINTIHPARSTDSYFICANGLEALYSLHEDTHREFGKKFYVEICQKCYQDFSLKHKTTQNSTGQTHEIHVPKMNEWIPNYRELKDNWLRKRNEKTQKS